MYFAALSTIRRRAPRASGRGAGLRRAWRRAESPLGATHRQLWHATAPALLLLDSFEHLLDAVPFIVELLTITASLKVLVTSRAVAAPL